MGTSQFRRPSGSACPSIWYGRAGQKVTCPEAKQVKRWEVNGFVVMHQRKVVELVIYALRKNSDVS
jgi:hypothetical protein